MARRRKRRTRTLPRSQQEVATAPQLQLSGPGKWISVWDDMPKSSCNCRQRLSGSHEFFLKIIPKTPQQGVIIESHSELGMPQIGGYQPTQRSKIFLLDPT